MLTGLLSVLRHSSCLACSLRFNVPAITSAFCPRIEKAQTRWYQHSNMKGDLLRAAGGVKKKQAAQKSTAPVGGVLQGALAASLSGCSGSRNCNSEFRVLLSCLSLYLMMGSSSGLLTKQATMLALNIASKSAAQA